MGMISLNTPKEKPKKDCEVKMITSDEMLNLELLQAAFHQPQDPGEGQFKQQDPQLEATQRF